MMIYAEQSGAMVGDNELLSPNSTADTNERVVSRKGLFFSFGRSFVEELV